MITNSKSEKGHQKKMSKLVELEQRLNSIELIKNGLIHKRTIIDSRNI